VTEDELAARATNDNPEVLDLELISRTDDTLVFTVESSERVGDFENDLKDTIADLLGPEFDREDIDLDIQLDSSKKRAVYQSTVTATISEPDDSPEPAAGFLIDSLATLLLSMVIFALF